MLSNKVQIVNLEVEGHNALGCCWIAPCKTGGRVEHFIKTIVITLRFANAPISNSRGNCKQPQEHTIQPVRAWMAYAMVTQLQVRGYYTTECSTTDYNCGSDCLHS